jgi:hypothetical protein
MGDAEQIADRWAHVIDLQLAAGGFRVDIQTHQRAESAAIHMRDVLKIKHDASRTRQQLANLCKKQLIQARDKASVAANDDTVFVTLNFKGQTGSGLAGHSVACDAQDSRRRNCYILRLEEEEPSMHWILTSDLASQKQ